MATYHDPDPIGLVVSDERHCFDFTDDELIALARTLDDAARDAAGHADIQHLADLIRRAATDLIHAARADRRAQPKD